MRIEKEVTDDIIEPSRRIITVCAYLRIVYALLAYSPNQETIDKIAVGISMR